MKRVPGFLMLVLIVVSISSLASASLVSSFDFTNGGSDWTVTVHDAGLPVVFEQGGDSTKVGYDSSTTATGSATLWQEVILPAGQTMSNLRLEANLSGFSSWIMNSRVAISTTPTAHAAQGTLVVTHASGAVAVDEPYAIDAAGNPTFTDVTSVWVGVDIDKGLAGVYKPVGVSQIKLYADVVPEPASLVVLLSGCAMLFGRRRR